MKSNDPDVHVNLNPFEWQMIGLLYYRRTADNINEGMSGQQPAHDWEPGDFPEQVDPRDLPFEFVAVFASVFSLMTSVKAWGTRKLSGKVQVCADNMYNPIKGVPSMYWFNTGVIDAKGIHLPTVNALTLGRAHPRNEVSSGHHVGGSCLYLNMSCFPLLLFSGRWVRLASRA